MTGPGHQTRVDVGTLLVAIGGALLLLSLFFDWYGPADVLALPQLNAWQSLEFIDVLLAAIALATLYRFAAEYSGHGLRTFPSWVGPSAGVVALVLVVVSLIEPPPVLALGDPSLETGIWLALGGAVLMTLGELLGRVRISLVATPRDRAAPPPPAPPHDPDAETRTLR